jgi:hypothetical protein
VDHLQFFEINSSAAETLIRLAAKCLTLPSQEVKFPTSKIGSSETGITTIQQALIGPIVVNQIQLNGFKGLFNYGSGLMENTQMDLIIKPYIDYWWGVCIDLWVDDYCVGDSGSVSLGTIDTGWSSLGDVAIKAGALSLDIDQTTFGPFKLTPLPIGGKEQMLTVSSIKANEIFMKNTSMSTGLPSVLGLDIPLPNPMGPQTVNVERVNMNQFATDGIRVPPMSFRDVEASNIQMDSVKSGSFEATGSFSKSTGWVNFVFVGFRLRVDIVSKLKASKLTMKNLSGKVNVNNVGSSGFTMSMNLRGINVAGLKINNFEIPTIDLEV